MAKTSTELTIEIRFPSATPKEASKALRWLAEQIDMGERAGAYNYPLVWKWKAKPAKDGAR